MKKRNTRLLILIVIALAAIAAILLFKNSSQETLNKDSDFAVLDTASVTRIFMADMNNNKVLLQRDSSGNWTVNSQHKAAPEAIKMILKTIMSIDVKNLVPKAAHNNVVKLMATSATKVEIYQKVFRIDLFDKIRWFPHEKCTKTYYVGIATQNSLGTYMLMGGAQEPYIVYIPGFNGFLSSRYSPLEKDWRDHAIFNTHYQEIASVTLRFSETPGESFKVIKKGQREFGLYKLEGSNTSMGAEIFAYDTLKLMDYFSAFEDVRFEAIIDDKELEKSKIDSIKRSVPYQVLTLEDISGKQTTVKTFRKKEAPGQSDIFGEPVMWDRDHMYALINDDKDFVMIQFFVFDPLLRPLSYFLPPQMAKPK